MSLAVSFLHLHLVKVEGVVTRAKGEICGVQLLKLGVVAEGVEGRLVKVEEVCIVNLCLM